MILSETLKDNIFRKSSFETELKQFNTSWNSDMFLFD